MSSQILTIYHSCLYNAFVEETQDPAADTMEVEAKVEPSRTNILYYSEYQYMYIYIYVCMYCKMYLI